LDPKSQLSFMSMAEGKGKDFYNWCWHKTP
jgi:hypothetical protein